MPPKFNPEDFFLGSVTVGERGQVVIPADARKRLGIHTGERLLAVCHPSEEGIMLLKTEAMREFLSQLAAGLSLAEQKDLSDSSSLQDDIENNTDSEDNK